MTTITNAPQATVNPEEPQVRPKFIRMPVDDFLDQFKPITNPLDPNASWNGCMFGINGRDIEHVTETYRKDPATVWTISDCDGLVVINNDMTFVNRLGYLITKDPCPEGTNIEAYDPDEDDAE